MMTGTGQGALATCDPGTVGDVRVRILCMRDDNLRTYTKHGVWRHRTLTNYTHSVAYCTPGDGLMSHHAETA
jgi:hypothetical protein